MKTIFMTDAYKSGYGPRAVAGFTLIELSIAVVILGILAATAISRFVNLSHEARAVTVTAAARTLVTAASMINLKVLAENIPVDGSVRQVDVGGGNMIDVRYGYPACTPDGIAKAAGTINGYVWYMGTNPDACTLYADMGKDDAGKTIYLNTCGVTYVSTQGRTWSPNINGC